MESWGFSGGVFGGGGAKLVVGGVEGISPSSSSSKLEGDSVVRPGPSGASGEPSVLTGDPWPLSVSRAGGQLSERARPLFSADPLIFSGMGLFLIRIRLEG